MHIVNENDELVQVVLVLNNSVATNVTIQVKTNDSTATGEHTKSINNILLHSIYVYLQEEVLIIILDHIM